MSSFGKVALTASRPTTTGALEAAESAAAPGAMSAGGGGVASPGAPPAAMALTEFHFVLLYASCVLAVSRLNLKVACRALPQHHRGVAAAAAWW